MMKLFRALDRGHFDFGWLETYHTFSFGEYYNPQNIRFGALRVFNDDTVEGGQGFGTHPHKDMEIISIPTVGVLAHRDSMGNEKFLHVGEVQVMSAGTGITHSEYNGSQTDKVKFFQIWIIPEKTGVEPRYEQKRVDPPVQNTVINVVGPRNYDAPLWIHQNAWLSLGRLQQDHQITLNRKSVDHGMFVFLVEGGVSINGTQLTRRDAVGISDVDSVVVEADIDSDFIVLDLPMI